MLKSSVGYENLHSTSPSHDKQTLKKFHENRPNRFSRENRQKMPLNTEISVMVSLSLSLSRRMTTIL